MSFIWFVWESRRVYLAFCPYRRRLFMVDGSRFYHRNRRPFCHSSPIRNLSPFPDGWGSWLYSWLSCMRGICMMSEIFRLLCSNRAFMDRSRPFGCFGSCLLRLFCLFQFRPAFCNGLPVSVWKSRRWKHFSGLSQPVFLRGMQPFQLQEPPRNVLTYAVNGAYGRA